MFIMFYLGKFIQKDHTRKNPKGVLWGVSRPFMEVSKNWIPSRHHGYFNMFQHSNGPMTGTMTHQSQASQDRSKFSTDGALDTRLRRGRRAPSPCSGDSDDARICGHETMGVGSELGVNMKYSVNLWILVSITYKLVHYTL